MLRHSPRSHARLQLQPCMHHEWQLLSCPPDGLLQHNLPKGTAAACCAGAVTAAGRQLRPLLPQLLQQLQRQAPPGACSKEVLFTKTLLMVQIGECSILQ
jgi:hypothetical protein